MTRTTTQLYTTSSTRDPCVENEGDNNVIIVINTNESAPSSSAPKKPPNPLLIILLIALILLIILSLADRCSADENLIELLSIALELLREWFF